MTKQAALDMLLAFLTEQEKDLFGRMYPNKLTPKQVDQATRQVSATLEKRSKMLAAAYKDIDALMATNETLTTAEESFNKTVCNLQAEIKELKTEVRYLSSNPQNVDNARVVEKLEKLELLEAGGVDNWSGYDYSMNPEDY